MSVPATTASVTTPAVGCVLHGWDLPIRLRASSPQHGPKALILDLDDTLYPREHYVQSGLMAVARYLHESHNVPSVKAFVAMSAARRERKGQEFQAVCARYALPATLVPSLVDIFRAHRPVLQLPVTTAAALARLRANGWQMAILTNGLPSVQRLKIEALGLSGLVRHVVCADEHAQGGKPSPVVFHEVLRRLALPADRVVMVGDDAACDIAGAKAVGLKSIRLAAAPRLPLLPEGDAVIDSLESLPAVAAALLRTVVAHAA